MIEPSELQLNNLVLYEGQEVEVIGLSNKIIRIDSGLFAKWVYADTLEGIPLTPELLERCGLVKKGMGYQIQIENRFTTHIMVCKNESKWYLYIDQKDEDDVNDKADIIQLMTNLEHLHTLQNLVKILTQKQLEITNNLK